MIKKTVFVVSALCVAAGWFGRDSGFCEEQSKGGLVQQQNQSSLSSLELSLKNALLDNEKLSGENQDLKKKLTDLESYAKTIMVLNTNLRNENDRLFQYADKLKSAQAQMRQMEESSDKLTQELREKDALSKKQTATIDALTEENLEFRMTLEGNELHQANLRYKKEVEELQKKVGDNSEQLSREVKDKESFKRECAVSHYNLGCMLFKIKDYPSATEEFKRSVVLNPLNADAFYNLGIIYDDYLNDNKSALMYYQQFLSLVSRGGELALPADESTINIVQKKMVQAEFREKAKVDSPIDQTIK